MKRYELYKLCILFNDYNNGYNDFDYQLVRTDECININNRFSLYDIILNFNVMSVFLFFFFD